MRTSATGPWRPPGAAASPPTAPGPCATGAFPALGLDRIQLFHAVPNPASGRVAAKAGFTLEGRLRRSHRYGDGVRHDELLCSRLCDDA